MKQIIKVLTLSIFSGILVFAPGLVTHTATVPVMHAAGALEDGLNKVGKEFTTPRGLSKSSTVTDVIVYVIKILLQVAMGIAVLFIIIGGYQYITSAGNEERATKGRKTLVNALIGLVLIIFSYTIVSVLNNQFAR